MTTVGHSLTGISIAILFAPRLNKIQQKIVYYIAFVFCALIPDIELSGWGHDRYYVSHSIVLMAVIWAVLALLSLIVPALRKRKIYWRLFLGMSLAWLSHYFLDSLYSHGYGVMVMWPISERRLNFSLPWFDTIPPFPVSMVHVRIVCIELLFYSPLVAGAALIKHLLHKRSIKMSRTDRVEL